ncbi:MAG: hypothetical protein U9R37_00240 [Campylobacterota bacterium]|nr:hypothetical protein [Campylobacterota bacterium]
MKKLLIISTITISIFAAEMNNNFFYNNGKKVYLTQNNSNIRTLSKEKRYFKTSNDTDITITKEILIKLKNKNDISNILSFYNLTLIKEYRSNTFLVSCEDINNTLNISNELYEDDRTLYAQPNYLTKSKKR